MAADLTVTHPMATSLGLSLEAAKKAVATKSQSKKQKYSSLCASHRIEFTPVALSTFGELDSDAEKFHEEAAHFYAGAQQSPQGDCLKRLKEQLLVVLAQQVGERLLAASGNF